MYVSRRKQREIFQSFSRGYVTALLGSRRVGKSSLVEHFISQNPQKNWVRLNMDSRSERTRVEAEELALIIEEKAQQKIQPERPLWVAIDEAQKCPELFEQIKILYDTFKGTDAIKFILTGSGFLQLHNLASESLAGRIEIYYLREFSLLEAWSLQQQSELQVPSLLENLLQNPDPKNLAKLTDEMLPFRPQLQRLLAEQLIWGGLPEVLKEPIEQGRTTYLANYLQTYLEKDVRDIGSISDLSLYQKLMEILAKQTGSLREDGRLVQALACHRDTLKKYRGYLEATLVYREVYPFIHSSLQRLVKSPKGYLLNNGLISYLTGIYDLNILEKTGAIGHRFENWVLRELQISLDGDPRRSEIFFWRSSGGIEVDLVIQKPPQIIPIEVTYAIHPDKKKLRHLKLFLKKEKQAEFGVIIYRGDFDWDEKNRIFYLPAWTLG